MSIVESAFLRTNEQSSNKMIDLDRWEYAMSLTSIFALMYQWLFHQEPEAQTIISLAAFLHPCILWSIVWLVWRRWGKGFLGFRGEESVSDRVSVRTMAWNRTKVSSQSHQTSESKYYTIVKHETICLILLLINKEGRVWMGNTYS